MMDLVAIDIEGELIEAGHVAPRLACLQIARPGSCEVFGRKAASTMLRSYIGDPEVLVIGHNIAFDLGVMCTHDESLIEPVFAAYEAGRVRETMIREVLIQIRNGRAIDDKNPKLDELAFQYLGYNLDKGEESVRYWYGDLMNTPINEWPPPALDYARRDPIATLGVFEEQQRVAGNVPSQDWPDSTVSPDEVLQTRAAWVLHLMRMWGFRTDGEMVATLKRKLEGICAEAEEQLLATGIYKIAGTKKAPKRSKDMKVLAERVLKAYRAKGEMPPLTEGAVKAQQAGERLEGDRLLKFVSCARDVLEATDDPHLLKLAEVGPAQKALSTFVPLIEAGTRRPIIVRWNALVRTGRTSCGDDDEIGNWQNPAKMKGIRESVRAREGMAFGSCDYSLAELCSFAEVCYQWFGFSDMRDAIIAGKDLHIQLACNSPTLLGHMSYEEAMRLKNDNDPVVDQKRQVAKQINFGYPGGMGPRKLVITAWKGGVRPRILIPEAEALKYDWTKTWRETGPYFERIAREDRMGYPAVQVGSGRLRGFQPGDFCSRANTYFQGKTADGAKHGGWKIACEMYVAKSSALYGCRPVLFVHDQWVIEGPKEQIGAATDRMAVILKEAMQEHTPNVPATLDMAIMERWYKGAKELRDSGGNLLIWQPTCKKKRAGKSCKRITGPIAKDCGQNDHD